MGAALFLPLSAYALAFCVVVVAVVSVILDLHRPPTVRVRTCVCPLYIECISEKFSICLSACRAVRLSLFNSISVHSVLSLLSPSVFV